MSRLTSGVVVVSSVAAIAAGFATAGAQSAVAAGSAAQSRTQTHYATAKRVCATPGTNHATCFAMQRVPATKSTPGARAYSLPSALPLGPAGGYTPGDVATAYGIAADSSGGSGQTVGIVDAYDDPTALADLNAFDTNYGLAADTASTFQKVSQTGTTSYPISGVPSGWDIEESLDLDAVRGLCNGCKILLVEATDNSDANLAAAVNEAVALGATVVSNSYGGPEGTPDSSLDAHYDHAGVPILASTGDDGWYSWDYFNDPADDGPPANVPNTPAALPSVIAVGGTTLNLNSDATRASEKVWNDYGAVDDDGTGDGATGGGCSTEYAAPSWQSAVANYSGTGCGTKRMTGDIAALADPDTGYDIYDSSITGLHGHWATYGGTSLASPLVAAMWALAGGGNGVTDPGSTLYTNFASDPSSLYDVTQGANGLCDETPSSCPADWGVLVDGGTAVNPNGDYLAPTSTYYDLDCAFVPNANGTQDFDLTVVTNHNQCYAASGYDGPSGVGVPTGLGAFTVGLRFASTAPTNAAVGQTYTPTYVGSGSSAAVVLSIDPSSTDVCSLSGGTVTFAHHGSCKVVINQDSDGTHTAQEADQTVTVNAAGTTTSVSVTPTTISATVTSTASATPAPTGNVSFTVGGASVGTAPVSNIGVATVTTSVPPGGARTVAATYTPAVIGDYTGSTGAVIRKDPTISAHVSSAHPKTKFGWYRSKVTVSFTCAATSAPLAGSCPAPVTLSTKGAGQSVTRTVSGTDGGAATAVVKPINIDLAKPTVKLSGVKSGHTYAKAPTIKVKAKDGLSGIASKHLSQKKSTKSGVTTVRYTVTVKDKAGNVRKVKGSYKIKS